MAADSSQFQIGAHVEVTSPVHNMRGKVKTKLYRKVTGHNSVRDEVHVALIRTARWWEGAVTEELDEARFEVLFEVVKQRFEFEAEELRLHREWVGGAWVPSLREQERVRGVNILPGSVKHI